MAFLYRSKNWSWIVRRRTRLSPEHKCPLPHQRNYIHNPCNFLAIVHYCSSNPSPRISCHYLCNIHATRDVFVMTVTPPSLVPSPSLVVILSHSSPDISSRTNKVERKRGNEMNGLDGVFVNVKVEELEVKVVAWDGWNCVFNRYR